MALRYSPKHRAHLLQRRAAVGVQSAGMTAEGGLRGVELGVDRLRRLGTRAAHVDAQQVLRTLHVVFDLGDRLELGETALVIVRELQHLTVHASHQLAQTAGGLVDDLPRGVGLGIGLAHIVQRMLILRVVAGLLLELGDVDRVLEGLQQLGLLGEVDAQVLVQTLGGFVVTIGQHELQAGDTQVGQCLVQQ